MESQERIKSEKLAYWYFRLNGFLTILNFVIHPESGGEQRTEVDILGVRFPYRAELLLPNPMIDDEVFTKINDKTCIIIAEVKRGTCGLNGPWIKPKDGNMYKVLKAIGAFKDDIIDEVTQKLYKEGVFENEFYYVSLFCVGKTKSPRLQRNFKNVPQVTWDDILKFIYDRFNKYTIQKADHSQWDSTGKKLWEIVQRCENKNEITSKIIVE